MNQKSQITKEFFSFLMKNKMWYIIPIVSVLLILGLLIILTEGSAIAPFIYTMF